MRYSRPPARFASYIAASRGAKNLGGIGAFAQEADPDARRRSDRRVTVDVHRQSLESFEERARQRDRSGRVGERHQHRELVAAETRAHIGDPQARGEQAGNAAQELIARAVPELVVDGLEVVEIKHDDGGGFVPAVGERLAAVELGVETATVQQARQWVTLGEVLQLLFETLAIADVLDLHHEMPRRTIAFDHERRRPLDHHLLPVAPTATALSLERRSIAARGAVGELALNGDVFGMQRVANRAPNNFGLIETKQLTYRPIHAQAVTVERNEDLANRCLLEGSAEIGFRALEQHLDRSALGDVNDLAEQVKDLAFVTSNRCRRQDDLDDVAVSRDVPLDRSQALALATHDLVEPTLALVDVLGVREALERRPDQLLAE